MKPRIALPPELSRRGFTTAEGLNAGLTRERMRGGDLQRPFHGVRVDSTEALSLYERCSVLQRRLPDCASFCGITAAALIGVPLPVRLENSGVVHVAVTPGRRAPSGRNVRGHTYRLQVSDLRIWNGLRLPTAERLWCELGGILHLADLVAAGDFLVHHRHPQTTEAMLRDAVSAYTGRRGIPRLTAALNLVSDRSESPQESRLRVMVLRAGIQGLRVNLPITTTGGHRYRADLVIPRQRLVIEYQGDIHRSTEAYRSDMTRASRLEADGWRVMFVNATDLNDETELVARIHRYRNQPIG